MLKQQPLPMSNENQFQDARFMTGDEKRKVIKHWEKFLAGGCDRHDFTHPLYHHLMQHCSFIAHFDISGFYHEYFVNGDDTVRFLSQFDRSNGCRSIEIGMDYWLEGGNDVTDGYKDINNAMVDVAAKYIPVLVAAAQKKQKDEDLRMARAILAKHKIKVVIP